MKNKFNIAMVAACPFPAQRGTPVRIFRTAEALSKRGHNVHVVTYHFGEIAARNQITIHRIKNVRFYQRYSAGPSYTKLLLLNPLLSVKLYNVLKSNDIDIIHAHHYEGLLVALSIRKLTNHPIVYDAHTMLGTELPSYSIFLPTVVKKLIGQCFDYWLPKYADHIISVTDNIKSALSRQNRMRKLQISVISNGVEKNIFRHSRCSRKLKKDGIKILIYTGNFAKFQGIDLLLKAFGQIRCKRKDVHLLLVSKFSFDSYKTLAKKLEVEKYIEVIHADFDELGGYFKQSDVALNPRCACDGIPQKLLNYMAAGMPIVSFEGSAKCLENNKTGIIVENENALAFSEAVIRLLDDPDMANKIGKNARNYVTSKLTWDKVAEKTEAVYQIIKR